MEPLIDTTTLHQINEGQDFSGEEVIVCRVVDKLGQNQKINPHPILFTEFYLHVFKKRSVFKKNCILSHSYPWNELLSIGIPEEKSILFTFKDNSLRFYANDSISLIEAIVFHLQEVRIANDMPKLDFDVNLLHKPTTTKTERRAREQKIMTKRIRFQAKALNVNLPPSFFNTVNQYTSRMRIFEDSSSIFDFRNLMSCPQAFDVILYALIGESSIKSVIIPQISGQEHWSTLGTLLKFSKSITEIETMEQPTENIKTFVDIVNSNKNTRLMSLKFRHAEYDEKFVSQLTLLIQHLPNLVQLAIEDSLTEKGLEEFVDNFNTCAEYERIEVLSLRETKGINIKKLIALAPKIRSLDLRGCDIDISTALKEFSRCELEVLDLSENKSLEPLDPLTEITPTLSKIIVSNVVWLQKNFINFLKFISNAQKYLEDGSLYMDISEIQIKDSQNSQIAVSAMKFISMPCLATLIFNGNQINSEFLSFLAHCTSLQSLSVTDSFLSSGPLYTQFLSIVKESKNIKELVIRSTKDPYTPQMTKSLFDMLKSNKSVQVLNFQDQHQGNSLLTHIIELIEKNNTITDIKFDNNSLSSLSALESVVQAAKKREVPLRLEIPKHDILDLANSSKNITDQMLSYHINMFKENNTRANEYFAKKFDQDEANAAMADEEGSSSLNSENVEMSSNSTNSSSSVQQAIPMSNRKTLPSLRISGRRSISDAARIKEENIKILPQTKPGGRKQSSAEHFDFSAVRKKFIDDDAWIDDQECVPVRDVSNFTESINNDLSMNVLLSLVNL